MPVGAVRDLTVDGGDGPIPARHYAPPAEASGAVPLLVYLHGGGFVVGDLDSYDAVCRLLCRHAGVHVLSIDYRLAPEHPFPAALYDARPRWSGPSPTPASSAPIPRGWRSAATAPAATSPRRWRA